MAAQVAATVSPHPVVTTVVAVAAMAAATAAVAMAKVRMVGEEMAVEARGVAARAVWKVREQTAVTREVVRRVAVGVAAEWTAEGATTVVEATTAEKQEPAMLVEGLAVQVESVVAAGMAPT